MKDYPTESELEQLKMLGDDWKNPQGVIDFLKRIWNWDDFVEVMGKKVIRLNVCFHFIRRLFICSNFVRSRKAGFFNIPLPSA